MSVSQVVAGIARRFGHGTAPFLLALALVAAAVSLTACSGSPFSKAASNHACGDKAAQAAISGSVPGLWNCLAPSLQSELKQVGATGDHALVGQAFASSYQYLGVTSDGAAYELTLLPQAAQSLGFHKASLFVWLDSNGKITGLNVGSSPN